MKKILSVLALLSLTACASTTGQYYEPSNFQPQQWATKSFDQAKAECRAESLKHNWMGDTYELETPLYKACMEKMGFRFGGAQ